MLYYNIRKPPPGGNLPDESGGLKQEALNGLKQIGEKAYVHDLKNEGYKRIFKYGIAFHKKTCEIAMENEDLR